MSGNDEAITIGLVMASLYLNYEPSKFVNYCWLRAMRTQRTFAVGWHVSPVYRNSLDRNAIYTATPADEPEVTEPNNPVALALSFRSMLDQGVVDNQSQLARQVGLTPSRVTQLLNLLKLPPDIVQELGAARGHVEVTFFTERRLRRLTRLSSPKAQHRLFQDLKKELKALQ